MISIIYMVPAVFLINMPCGYWRQSSRKFSVQWFLAVHFPVALIIIVRKLIGMNLSLSYFLLIVPAYFIGQTVGARIQKKRVAGLSSDGQ